MTSSAISFETVFRELHPRLWRALVAFTGTRDLASDAEAEAFTQAIGRGSEIRNPEAWIWSSAFRIASGLLAERAKLGDQEVGLVQQFDDAPVIDLLSMLKDLSEQQRQVVTLRYVGNFKPVEIAELLETSSATVRVQLHRAHESLRSSQRKERD